MTPIETLTDSELQRLRIACAYLFSPESAGDDGFLKQLNIAAIEKAFRREHFPIV